MNANRQRVYSVYSTGADSILYLSLCATLYTVIKYLVQLDYKTDVHLVLLCTHIVVGEKQ